MLIRVLAASILLHVIVVHKLFLLDIRSAWNVMIWSLYLLVLFIIALTVTDLIKVLILLFGLTLTLALIVLILLSINIFLFFSDLLLIFLLIGSLLHIAKLFKHRDACGLSVIAASVVNDHMWAQKLYDFWECHFVQIIWVYLANQIVHFFLAVDKIHMLQ